MKGELFREALEALGFDLAPPRGARHHGDIGCCFLYEELRGRGASLYLARGLARAVTAHHAQFPTDAKAFEKPGKSEGGQAAIWEQARCDLVRELAAFFQIEELPQIDDLPPASVVLLAGLTSVADWIGSMAEVFAYQPPQASLASYWGVAFERAERALAVAGFRAPAIPSRHLFHQLFDKTPWPLDVACEQIARARPHTRGWPVERQIDCRAVLAPPHTRGWTGARWRGDLEPLPGRRRWHRCYPAPVRYLHTMIRVLDLDAALAFFCDTLGLVEVRRRDSEQGRFTLVFLATHADAEAQVELTHNWDQSEPYTSGRNFGHLAYAVDDIYAICDRLQRAGVTINRPPRDGRMAFVRSPDGISIELLQAGDALPPQEPWASMANTGEW